MTNVDVIIKLMVENPKIGSIGYLPWVTMPPPNRDPAKICQIGVGRLLSLCGIIVGRPLASIWLLAKCDATNHQQGMHLALHSTMGEQGPFRSAGRVFLDGHQWVLSCAETDFMGIP